MESAVTIRNYTMANTSSKTLLPYNFASVALQKAVYPVNEIHMLNVAKEEKFGT